MQVEYGIALEISHKLENFLKQKILLKEKQDVILQEDLYLLMEVICRLKESLISMAFNEEISKEVLSSGYMRGSNSAFFRLASLLGSANSKISVIDLAECGVFNRGDTFTKLQHLDSE